MRICLKQAKELVELFGGDEAVVCLAYGDDKWHSGPGLYAWFEDYQDEGCHYLGMPTDEDGEEV